MISFFFVVEHVDYTFLSLAFVTARYRPAHYSPTCFYYCVLLFACFCLRDFVGAVSSYAILSGLLGQCNYHRSQNANRSTCHNDNFELLCDEPLMTFGHQVVADDVDEARRTIILALQHNIYLLWIQARQPF